MASHVSSQYLSEGLQSVNRKDKQAEDKRAKYDAIMRKQSGQPLDRIEQFMDEVWKYWPGAEVVYEGAQRKTI